MPCLIVGTQVDLRDDNAVRDKLAKQKMSPVSKEAGERLAKELGAVKYVECSALTQYKLKDVFDEVCTPLLFRHLRLTWTGNRGGIGTSPETRQIRSQGKEVCHSMTLFKLFQYHSTSFWLAHGVYRHQCLGL